MSNTYDFIIEVKAVIIQKINDIGENIRKFFNNKFHIIIFIR